MFTRHSGGHRRVSGPFGFLFTIFRLFLSLVIMGVLLIGIYSAYKSFSGVDPLKADLGQVLSQVISFENFIGVIKGFLSMSPKESIDTAGGIITGKQSISDLSKNTENNSSFDETLDLNVPFNPSAPLSYKFALVSDSHTDNVNLENALKQAKAEGVEFVIGLGDYTNVGTIDELRDTKIYFDRVNISYYSTAGDHDLWDGRNKGINPVKNYSDIFGSAYSSFGYGNARILLIFNTDLYKGVDEAQMSWINGELDNLKQNKPQLIFVMAGTPFYHPSSDHQMGRETPSLKDQAQSLIAKFKEAGVSEVFAGDTHFFSRYKEPKSNLRMSAIGAVTSERNTQTPRVAIVDVYQDGRYNVRDVEIR